MAQRFELKALTGKMVTTLDEDASLNLQAWESCYGDIDMDAITKELRDSSFEGWIIVEDECDEAITNPDQVTLNAGAYVEKVMRPLLNN